MRKLEKDEGGGTSLVLWLLVVMEDYGRELPW
jgi:hypothetical protein